MFEEAPARSEGVAGLCPEAFEGLAEAVEGEGQEGHGGQEGGEVLLAVAGVVLEVVAVVFDHVEGIALDLDERERLIASRGGKNGMIRCNHGLLTLGRGVPEAFTRAYCLEKACEIQMDALAMGRPLRLPPPEVCEHAARQYDRFYESGASGSGACEMEWAANRRTIDRVNPGYEG